MKDKTTLKKILKNFKFFLSSIIMLVASAIFLLSVLSLIIFLQNPEGFQKQGVIEQASTTHAFTSEHALAMARKYLPSTNWIDARESEVAPGMFELLTEKRVANFHYDPVSGYFLIGIIINPYNQNALIADGEFTSED